MGAAGANAASAHLCTREFVDMIDAGLDGRVADGRAHAHALLPLVRALFAEPSPAVLKAVLHVDGRIPTPDVRMPMANATKAALAAALEAHGCCGQARARPRLDRRDRCARCGGLLRRGDAGPRLRAGVLLRRRGRGYGQRNSADDDTHSYLSTVADPTATQADSITPTSGWPRPSRAGWAGTGDAARGVAGCSCPVRQIGGPGDGGRPGRVG